MTKALKLTIFFLAGGAVIILAWVLLDWFIFSRAEPEVHLIPSGYAGPVVIAFDQENGTAKRYEDGKRVYEIPPSGVLRTQFAPNSGTRQHWEFYYISGDGIRSAVPYDIFNFKDSPKEGSNTTGVFSIHMVSSPIDQTGKKEYFFTYVIGKIANAASLIKRQHEVRLNEVN